VLNNGKNVSRAQSWGQVFAVVRHLTRLSLTEGGWQVRGWPPCERRRIPLEADLDMGGGAVGVGRVGLGVSSWNSGRRPCGGVFDLCGGGNGCGPPRGASCWMSISSGSTAAGLLWLQECLVSWQEVGVQGSPCFWLSAVPRSLSRSQERPGSSGVWF